MDLKVRKHIYFYGRVQGVGFRYYAVQKAGQLGLAGWVRNRYDGSVEMEVEGADDPLFTESDIYLDRGYEGKVHAVRRGVWIL